MARVSPPAPLLVAPHVADALSRGTPVVALESTVLTHGLPRPRNLALAHRMEALVQDQGAVPATVGVIDGRVVVGLAADQLERLSMGGAEKASTWNLDRKSTRLNSSHVKISYAVFCLKKKKTKIRTRSCPGG